MRIFQYQEEYIDFLKQPENRNLLVKNDLDTLFRKIYGMYDRNPLSYWDECLQYVTELLYDNGFLVENYISRTYPDQFHYVNRETIYLPKCKQIERFSFYENKHIKEVKAPNALVVGDSAFEGCENLHKVYLPNVTELGNNVFKFCGLLTLDNIKLPQNIVIT